MHPYGCRDCGSTSFHASGVAIEEPAGANTTPPSVRRTAGSTPVASEFGSTLWSCANDHQVPLFSGLWFALALIADREGDPLVPLPKNAA